MPPYAFLSHSSKDKAFARYLDASLTVHGVTTFLDERDILVGESIPARVYETLSHVTHLICVISPNSVVSRWTRDELDAATMRGSGVCRVLPVLIAPCEIPPSLRHIKYADFSAWEDPSEYTKALGQLLSSLGVARLTPALADLDFFVSHHLTLANAERKISMLAGALDGGGYADYLKNTNIPQSDGVGVRIMAKDLYYEDRDLSRALEHLGDLLAAAPSMSHRESPLRPIAAALQQLNYAFELATHHGSSDEIYANAKLAANCASRLSGVLAERMSELVAILVAMASQRRPIVSPPSERGPVLSRLIQALVVRARTLVAKAKLDDDNSLRGRTARTVDARPRFCTRCGAGILPWWLTMMSTQEKNVETYERWLDTACASCGSTPRESGIL
jgi:hypothetical protein